MKRASLTELRVRGFGSVVDATLRLTPLHALIGPNDSGKSTLLHALRALAKFAQLNGTQGAMSEFNLYARDHSMIEAVVPGTNGAVLARDRGQWGECFVDPDAREALGGAQTLRLEPESLRRASPLIAEDAPLRLTDERGLGLPAVYDAIISRDVNAYLALSKRLSELFPNVKALALKNPTERTKALGVQLHDGSFISATTMSEGLLYWLAYAAVPFLAPTAFLLLEEPETGLHPARIRDVMMVLREVSQWMQVVLATHSPLVTSELEPNEVTLVTRDPEHGTRATLLQDVTAEMERALWLRADRRERPLLP